MTSFEGLYHPSSSALVMDYASCYVLYVDRTARGDRLVKKDTTPSAAVSTPSNASSYLVTLGETEEVQANLRAILAVFNEGMPAV